MHARTEGRHENNAPAPPNCGGGIKNYKYIQRNINIDYADGSALVLLLHAEDLTA